jgi:ABC-2 type transport system ATP-binding protein
MVYSPILNNKEVPMGEPSVSNKTKEECEGDSIHTEGIKKRFGKTLALDGIDLVVEPNSIFALLGPNGSGKTTFIRILTTLLQPDSGTASVGGFDVTRDPGQVRRIIGLAGQYPAVDEDLSGRENLEMIGRLYHLGIKRARSRAAELLEQFQLADASSKRVRFYSGGMRRRLDLAATLVGSPRILFLDEPTTGLDPQSRLALWEVISRQAYGCNTVFLTTQYLEEADRLAQKVAIIDRGRIIRTGTPAELKECCGGESRIVLKVTNPGRTDEAVAALKGITADGLRVFPQTGEINFPARDGSSSLFQVVERLQGTDIDIKELALKQPTLDDVFLAITGHTAEDERKAVAPHQKDINRRGPSDE